MFKVGQKLWLVSSQRSGCEYEVTVLKVGRIWATLDNRMRCDSSGLVDGGRYTSPGCCYVSRDDYKQKLEREIAWAKFKRSLLLIEIPDSLTVYDIKEISARLGIYF